MTARPFAETGWIRFDADARSRRWAAAAQAAGQAALRDPALDHWYQCARTWFVGVDALPNDAAGGIARVPLAGPATDWIARQLGPLPALHRAQLSVMFPGYPQPRAGEGEAAFRYRLKRDSAHVDGLLAEGPDRRRHLREPHAWILGVALSETPPEAAPLVVWEGSHHVMRRAFAEAFSGLPPDRWGDVDVTDIYQAARREVFEACPRVPLPAQPGESHVIHRMALHGVAPWTAPEAAEATPRMIAYFRPMLEDTGAWLGA